MTFSLAFFVDSVPFTTAVVNGETSLGGSESAMLGLARALRARGHSVHIFATKLDADAEGPDRWGCHWLSADALDAMNAFYEWDVFVSLRMPGIFASKRKARLRVLWNQDLMDVESFSKTVMAVAWALDKVVYVSEYHRAQWEDVLPELKPFGYVTKNGFDPAHVPDLKSVVKDPNRIIHISRPERGLAPILEMWPAFKAEHPQVELRLCRYSSMYDSGGWGEVCREFDRRVQAMAEKVGGITYLGELNKAQLYREISEAAVMWYPGVPTFAETSCIASIESQACGTPFVGSWKGALAESVPHGILIEGDAFTPEYQAQSRAALATMLDGCAKHSFEYRQRVNAGLKHVEAYRYDVLAAEWETWLTQTFQARYDSNTLGVLRKLLHYDDHAAALQVARDIMASEFADDSSAWQEARAAADLCERVIAGKDQVESDYAERALDPLVELNVECHTRLQWALDKLEGCTRVLDVACGSGAFALGMAQRYPEMQIVAVDYAAQNIEAAKKAAIEIGVADRIEFICAPVWDFETNAFSGWWETFRQERAASFDGLWSGEFIEHIEPTTTLIDGLEAMVAPGSAVVLSCPQGPLSEYLERDTPYNRGHIHCFGQADLRAVFGKKQGVRFDHIPWGYHSPRGEACGNWLISYRASGAPTGERPFAQHIVTTRPKAKLSIGILAGNVEHDLGRCLEQLWPIADEIVIGDTGSKDHTADIVKFFPARIVRTVNITSVQEHEDGFAGARNDVLQQCTGDWFMWVDSDEVVVGTAALWQYLESGPYKGYAIHQNHLQLDAPNHFDKPIRVFKPENVQFYGCVHEQPQQGDCNGDITPSLELFDVQIAHTGYLSHSVRRQKMLHRNLALLEKDAERFPDRVLGKLLWLRDYVNLCDVDYEETGVKMTPRAAMLCLKAIQLFDQYFKDPAHKMHDLARPFYESALQRLGKGYEMEFALAGHPGGLEKRRAKPQRFWVRSAEELEAIVQHKTKEATEKMKPRALRLDPIVARERETSLV